MKETKIQHMLRITADSARAGIIILDAARRIQYANTRAAEMAGVPSPEHLLNTSYDTIVQRSLVLEENGSIADPSQFPSTLALEEGIKTNDRIYEYIIGGAHYWLNIDATPFFDEAGVPEYAVIRFVDVSSKKWKEDRLNFLIETMQVLTQTSDYRARLVEKVRLTVPRLADWCTLNIVNIDDTLSRVLVKHRDPKKEPLLRNMCELLQKDLEDECKGIMGVLKTGQAIHIPEITESVLRGHGLPEDRISLARELQICSSIALPIMSRGTIVGVLSLAYAESGRRYTEEDLRFMEEYCHYLGSMVDSARMYEEIQKRDKTKDDFLAALSHELRNPLAPIKSSLEMLQLMHKEPSSKGELAIVQRQFEHFTSIVNDLLDVTRFTRGKISLEKNRMDLAALVRDVAASYSPFIHERRITFLPIVSDAPIFVRGDAVRLKQAIMNLLDNAQKFTPPGGKISISLSEENRKAVISVADTGIGIAENELDRIFDLHFQGSNKNKDRRINSGLGMGLVLVKDIVELHGGHIEAKSGGLGRGFECRIKIPTEVRVPVRG